MHRVLVVIALGLMVAHPRNALGKVCPSMDVRNGPKSLEKLRNCSIIMGRLQIVLMHTESNESYFQQYSFPELTEIVDYLLVFRVTKLTTLGRLFPNLKIIRGHKLFEGFALVLFRTNLQEIGLKSLEYIGGQGGIKVDYSPNLCYVRTVNWTAMGASELDFPPTEASDCRDEVCPNDCPSGPCWNSKECQKRTSTYCPYFIDVGNNEACVKACPPTKVIHYETMRCFTENECISTFRGTWWAFNGTCVNVCPPFYERDATHEGGCRYIGSKYKKYCLGDIIRTQDNLSKMNGCTHINGSLELRIVSQKISQNLERDLGNIVSISGYLKIGRSSAITSLAFFKNLTMIRGETLSNNEYALFVYENENLRKLWNFDSNFNLTILAGMVAFHDNPQLCLSEIEKLEKAGGISNGVAMQISQYSNGYKSVCYQKSLTVSIVEKNPTNVTLSWEPIETSNKEETVLGYTIYFSPAGRRSDNNKDMCANEPYVRSIFVRENKVQLTELLPYTRYIYHIKTYTTGLGEQTPTYKFETASTEPSEVLELTAEATSDTTIIVKWKPPNLNNGLLTHYVINKLLEDDYLPTIQQRNYCEYPHQELSATNVSTEPPKDNCTCSNDDFEEYIEEDAMCGGTDNPMENCMMTLSNNHSVYVPLEEVKTIWNDSDAPSYHIPVNETSYGFNNLKPYSLYVFHVQACNLRGIKEQNEFQCGPLGMVSVRTKKNQDADMIRSLSVTIHEKTAHVEWLEPEVFNSVLVSYNIEYKRSDSEHSKPRSECITHSEYLAVKRTHKIQELSAGKYAVRVQAISYAGPGNFSDWEYFAINSESNSTVIVWIVGCTFVVGFLATVLGYLYCRKRLQDDRHHLIASINPDYAGPIYVEDEWEIDRDDVEIYSEIGKGTFGSVHRGCIKSKQYQCAVKTISEDASLSSRMEFLNEGAVMKGFNDAHHVIKLLGIVSRGTRPLVIMELMDRGDLKMYLRRAREPSQNLTTNELYRMAAQIADGMAYLSAKKFVHRDLAARNCMVAADHTVKIGDFGMARDIYLTDYYRKDTAGLLPVRWMAPESLADGVFTSDSDVWSYGIVLWEMATLGQQPYQGQTNEQVFRHVKSGGKPDRPTECSDLMYEVMDACWAWRPYDRPTFMDIVRKLASHVGEDFRLVAFTFSDQARHVGPRVYNPPAMMSTEQKEEDEEEEEYGGHYRVGDDEVSLYLGAADRPHSSRHRQHRSSSPEHISPGSPSTSYLFGSS